MSKDSRRIVEWPTLALMIVCPLFWGLVVFQIAAFSTVIAIPLAALSIAFHSSLQHEAIHLHPTRHGWLNALLVFPAIGLFIPYVRFRDTHLAHHTDARLTDPFDDPESNYLDPADWDALPRWLQRLLLLNNTLLGRLLIGPAYGTVMFAKADAIAIWRGDRAILAAWLWHFAALVPVIFALSFAAMPLWAYLIAAYFGLSLLKLRTFLEHQAAARSSQRSAIVEDAGIFAFLFLNNNLHAVHHKHPKVPWYELPKLFRANRAAYLNRNGGYRFASYREVAGKFLLRRKDPVPHPLWRRPR